MERFESTPESNRVKVEQTVDEIRRILDVSVLSPADADRVMELLNMADTDVATIEDAEEQKSAQELISEASQILQKKLEELKEAN